MTAFYIENVNNTLKKTMGLFIIRCFGFFSMLLSRCSLFVVIFTVFFFFQSICINLELSSTLMFRNTS